MGFSFIICIAKSLIVHYFVYYTSSLRLYWSPFIHTLNYKKFNISFIFMTYVVNHRIHKKLPLLESLFSFGFFPQTNHSWIPLLASAYQHFILSQPWFFGVTSTRGSYSITRKNTSQPLQSLWPSNITSSHWQWSQSNNFFQIVYLCFHSLVQLVLQHNIPPFTISWAQINLTYLGLEF